MIVTLNLLEFPGPGGGQCIRHIRLDDSLSYWEIEDVLAAILVTMDSDTALKDYEFKTGDTAVIEIDGRRPYYFLCAPDGWEQLPQPEDFAPGFAPQPEPMNGLAKITGGLSEDGEQR